MSTETGKKKTLRERLLNAMKEAADRKWYLPLVLLLSALDAYIFIIPNEALLIGAVLPRPKRWFLVAAWFSIGSAIGAASFAGLTGLFGEPMLHAFFPSVLKSPHWSEFVRFTSRHGFWGLALISFSPFPQHVAVAIVGLAHMPLTQVFFAVLIGRALKYFGVAWAVQHSPRLLKRIGLLPDSTPRNESGPPSQREGSPT